MAIHCEEAPLACPICLNAEGKLIRHSKSAEPRRAYAMVFCPTCPVTFEIRESDLEFLESRPKEGLAQRNRWAQLLAEAAARGETLYRLPS